jgi:hypothetical protein
MRTYIVAAVLVTVGGCSADELDVVGGELQTQCRVELREAAIEVEPGQFFATSRAVVGVASGSSFEETRFLALQDACSVFPALEQAQCVDGHGDYLTGVLESEQEQGGTYNISLEVVPRARETAGVGIRAGEAEACAEAVAAACRAVDGPTDCVRSGAFEVTSRHTELVAGDSGQIAGSGSGSGNWSCTVPSCTIKGQCATSSVSWGWHCNYFSFTCGEGHDGIASVDYQTGPTMCARKATADMCSTPKASCNGSATGCGYDTTKAGWTYTASSDESGTKKKRSGTAGKARDCDLAFLIGCPCPGTFTGNCESTVSCSLASGS